jgi:threonine aldolase
MEGFIDLRSDTVSQPTPAMREAMYRAEVGDDVYGEDVTVNRLEAMAADRLGKEAGLFVPSGTMGNLVAVLSHCQRGDEVLMGHLGHTFLFEGGGISALGGIFAHTLQNKPDGSIDLDDIRSAIRGSDIHQPVTRLLVLENTHNRCGGTVLDAAYTRSAGDVTHEKEIMLHLDGARIFNAAAALDTPVKDLVDPVDSVTFCLSKGLCAPVGSVLCGSHGFIQRARRIRKQLGGGMRQVGIIAAAGIVALEQMVERLVEDHQRAKRLAESLSRIKGVYLTYGMPPSNLVFVSMKPDVDMDAKRMAAELRQEGILVGVVGAQVFRLALHYWIDDSAVERTISAFERLLHP